MNPVSTAARSLDGDASAEGWEARSARLFQDLRRPAIAMLRRGFGSAFAAEEIEDIYSSAWVGTLRALARRQAGLADEEIRKYVLTAVAHQASKELRRRRRRPTSPIDEAPEVLDPIAPAPEEQAVAAEERGIARELLVTLPPRRRAVMMLRYGWGLEPHQVCRLVKGLSPRAYRKEITRGVNDLTERMRLIEKGEWCRDREPLLKAYAAGVAGPEENRQARHHLGNCRSCAEFVGRLTGHLHDIGSAAALSLAVGGADHRGRLAALFDRLGLSGRGQDTSDALSTATAQSGVARGGGSAGAGLLAKLAGLGAGGKLAAICAAGGAAAVTCAAVGIAPMSLDGPGPTREKPAHVLVQKKPRHTSPPTPVTLVRPPANEPSPRSSADSAPTKPTPRKEPAQSPETDAGSTPVVATATPAESEFGTPAAAAPAASAASSSGDSGGSPESSAVGSEFGP